MRRVSQGGGGGGAVSSVNTKTGAVTLAAGDVGALPATATSGKTTAEALAFLAGSLTAAQQSALLTLLSAGGAVLAGAGGQANAINGAAVAGVGLTVYPTSVNGKGLIVRALASQAAGTPMLDVQNSSGGSLATLDTYGALIAQGTVRGQQFVDGNYSVLFGNGSATLGASTALAWTNGNSIASNDVGVARAAAGVLRVTNGSTGQGTLRLGAFTTAARPAAATAGAGGMIYDTSLSKPVWSDGTTWRDATGGAV